MIKNVYKSCYKFGNMTKTKKGDYVEIEFTGYHDGIVFDSNIPEELIKLNPNAEANQKTVIAIGQKMVVEGLDKALEDKELNKEYNIHVLYKEGFGERKRDLVKTIPLNVFTKQKIDPKPGATLILDNMLARVITVSGARVITDFNNPLAGKDLDYKFKIKRLVTDVNEKSVAFFEFFFRFVPKFEIIEKKAIVKGTKELEEMVKQYKDKFNEIVGIDIEFKEEVNEENKEESSKI
jgi:peptidylprolyl isomerase